MASRLSFVSEAAVRVLVVANPSAGARSRHEAIQNLVDCLFERRLQPQVVTDLAQLDELVERLHQAGELRAIVAAGGDGTVAEIVNRTRPDVPVTVYPLGTANLLATYFHLQRDPFELANTLMEGAIAQLDAGCANGRIFLLMVGCGFDADVVTRLHRRRSGGHISYWTYARPILEAIRSYEYPTLRVYCEPSEGERASAKLSARWAFVVNLPCYAAGLSLAPEAVATDGLLNVSTFHSGSLWHGLRYLGYVALGRQRALTDHGTAMATRLRIESDKPVPYQLDGDPGGFLPLEIDVLPNRLTLLAPLARMLTLGFRPATESSAGAAY